MHLIYDNNPKGKFTGSVMKMDPNKYYLDHYNNFLYLSFMAKNGNTLEKIQAGKEILIAQRKMKFWKRHENFDEEFVMIQREKANKSWGKWGEMHGNG